MSTAFYDPTQVLVTIGTYVISGFAEGSMIKAARNKENFKLTVGADGAAVRSQSADKSGKVTLTLLQSSDSNAALSAIEQADVAANVPLPLLIKDNNGISLCTAPEAWVTKPADLNREAEAKDVVWILECTELDIVHGGY